MKRVYVIGTCDTKGPELAFACRAAREAGAAVTLVDISTRPSEADADIPAKAVGAHHPEGADAVFGTQDRGVALAAMAVALERFLSTRGDIGAVLGLGGSGNTTVVTAAMRALPVGVPKLMVSTMASGNTAPYVGASDITMMYSVVDIAGLNPIATRVIGNAAGAAAGMCAQAPAAAQPDAKPGLGMTMFGVTTACINAIRAALEADYECYVFHATGVGGRSMEKLAESGFMAALVDITTTEVADMLVGGVFASSEDRFGAAIRHEIPWVGSVGALDMVNFGPRDTVPPQFRDRNLYVHNASVTLMRTTPEENAQVGRWIVERVNRMPGKVRFLLPRKGVSALDVPGAPFHDPEADAALFQAILDGFSKKRGHELLEVDAAINDPAFAAVAVAALRDVLA